MTFIKGETCELRAWEDEDSEPFTKAVNAGLTTKFMMTGSVPMRTADYADRFRKMRDAGDILFGIWVPGSSIYPGESLAGRGLLIGQCGLHDKRDVYRSAEFRILIFNPEFIGKGIGEEATRLTVDYAFARMNLHRVWLGYNEENVGAGKCYERVGFKREGVLREDLYCYGHYVNAIRMGLLEQEWTSPSSVKAE